jgi:hypothetical protein
MKVITEEWLRRKFTEYIKSPNFGMQLRSLVIRELLKECQELDNLKVTLLRPMVDAPKACNFLIKKKCAEGLTEACLSIPNHVWDRGLKINLLIDECEGWLPLPLYKPEQS